MKKILAIILASVMVLSALALASCGSDTSADTAADTSADTSADRIDEVIVQTNAFFAPFEYYEGTEITGVDPDIMAMVGEKLGAKITFQNVEFAVIIDNVAAGKVCDCGAAGITITDSRKEKVDFSTPYYTSVQYVIWAEDDDSIKTVNDEYITWDALAGKKVGVQTDTTGHIYTDLEINGDHSDPDDDYTGVLEGTNTEMACFDNAQLAADGINANQIDAVIIDKLPAEYIVSKNSGFKCLPLYYAGADGEEDSPVEEQYAICVTKGSDTLLNAINEVLADLMVADENGETEVDKLIMKHMGLDG